jgi:hypothetical protein
MLQTAESSLVKSSISNQPLNAEIETSSLSLKRKLMANSDTGCKEMSEKKKKKKKQKRTKFILPAVYALFRFFIFHK